MDDATCASSTCRQPVVDRGAHAKYCSATCRQRERERRRSGYYKRPRSCDHCLGPLITSDARKRMCDECRDHELGRRWRQWAIAWKSCLECGEGFWSSHMHRRLFCSITCSNRSRNRDKNHRRRAAVAGGERIVLRELCERDRWRCHLCLRAVPRSVGAQHRLAPTIDHLVPLSSGGAHAWLNVALAHRECNIRRGANGEAQLRLIA